MRIAEEAEARAEALLRAKAAEEWKRTEPERLAAAAAKRRAKFFASFWPSYFGYILPILSWQTCVTVRGQPGALLKAGLQVLLLFCPVLNWLAYLGLIVSNSADRPLAVRVLILWAVAGLIGALTARISAAVFGAVTGTVLVAMLALLVGTSQPDPLQEALQEALNRARIVSGQPGETTTVVAPADGNWVKVYGKISWQPAASIYVRTQEGSEFLHEPAKRLWLGDEPWLAMRSASDKPVEVIVRFNGSAKAKRTRAPAR